MKKKIAGFLLIILFFFANCFYGCKKEAGDKLLGPGIVLTVDAQPADLYFLKDFLKENNIKLTFYISGYTYMNSSSKSMMRAMISDGHEMAHHTRTHPNSLDYIAANGMNAYLNDEIFPVIDSMKKDGIPPVDFAYPNGACSIETDKILLNYFNSLRKIISPYLNKHISDVDQIYYRYGNIKLFYGCSIDNRNNYNINDIYDALAKAKNSRQTISLYCHYVSDNTVTDNINISIADFKSVVLKAKELGLRFYTVSEISRNVY